MKSAQDSLELDILVVAYRARQELIQTIASIALFSAPGYRLTTYENSVKNYPLTWIWNRFTEQSRRPYIALCNADIIVGPAWDSECLSVLKKDSSVGMVQPLANYGRHNEALKMPVSVFPGSMDLEMAPEVMKHLQSLTSVDELALGSNHDLILGHCFIFPRSAWVDLGGFNEKIPYGGNEYDFSRRLVQRGSRLAVTRKSFAYHLWNRSARDAIANGEWDAQRHQPKFSVPPDNKGFSEI